MINPKVEALKKLSKEMGKLLSDRVKEHKLSSVKVVEDDEEEEEES